MDSASTHAVLFPFMSKGHTIPVLDLARLLLRLNTAVTLFTTPANRPFIADSLSDTNVSILSLPFPKQTIPEIPLEVESTDKLPCMSLFPTFALSTELIKPHFEKALESLSPRVDFMVTDGFLWWTLASSRKYNIPRLIFYGMCNYAMCVSRAVGEARLLFGQENDDELISVPQFPWIKVTRNDFEPPFNDPEPKGPHFEFVMKVVEASSLSCGYVMNSFYELEPVFVDHWNKKNGDGSNQKAWCVGPLCLAEEIASPRKVIKYNGLKEESLESPIWVKWLNEKLDQGRAVLFVAFGSQADISLNQIKEIAVALEESEADFLWVIRKEEWELGFGDGFEERVKERGLVVRGLVDQRVILGHPSVEGFLSHCGWNSVSESICAGVPILAWPMMAEQPLNARMVVEEIKVGLRVETCDRSVRGFVKREGLKIVVKELMQGETGKEIRERVREYAKMAKAAMEKGTGSSWRSLDLLIDEMCKNRHKNM